jgi:H/ACA ribonucleoprotein complex subunit 3
MAKGMAWCMGCGSYTLKETCSKCKENTITPHPPKFSPEDRYGKYRRQLKAMTNEESK